MTLVSEAAAARGVTRLCHFTPSHKLAEILREGMGLLATQRLKEDDRVVFDATDLRRLDGYEGHLCCSLEYPNGYYFDVARQKDRIFTDWVVVFLKLHTIDRPGVHFCASNASTLLPKSEGLEAFLSLFADEVRNYTRQKKPSWCTTDLQAEVLVPDGVAVADIDGVAFSSETQAQRDLARLRQIGVTGGVLKGLDFVVAPMLFQKLRLSQAMQTGQRPLETTYRSRVRT
jgi:ssDNA thymidine ADP-ribosyltransferase DarT-like protein